MRLLISPAKKLDALQYDRQATLSQPRFLPQAKQLVDILAQKSAPEIATLMKLSTNLAELNETRFQQWQTPFTTDNAHPAIFFFAGDVYQGLQAASLSTADIDFAQEQLRILSGLYGILRPLDLIQPYRLEMGTRLTTPLGRTLYDFWGATLTHQLNHELGDDSVLINLASEEYFKSIHRHDICCPIITPVFREYKNGSYKIVSFYAKRARGLMARFMIQNRIENVADLKAFNVDGYAWNANQSDATNWVFTRHQNI